MVRTSMQIHMQSHLSCEIAGTQPHLSCEISGTQPYLSIVRTCQESKGKCPPHEVLHERTEETILRCQQP